MNPVAGSFRIESPIKYLAEQCSYFCAIFQRAGSQIDVISETKTSPSITKGLVF